MGKGSGSEGLINRRELPLAFRGVLCPAFLRLDREASTCRRGKKEGRKREKREVKLRTDIADVVARHEREEEGDARSEGGGDDSAIPTWSRHQ